MGLEIPEGFRPITPIRTSALSRAHTSHGVVVKCLDLKEDDAKGFEKNEDEECTTPKSQIHTLKTPLLCPPAPRKPRPAKRKAGPPPEGFFHVPRDLTAVFVSLPNVSKKIKAG
uniref:Cyclin-dependent protein kinase inhibitor SMR6-like n=1 Tax=Nelumbo nucifera TaxID=4432 RepID=A0A822ZQ99_NELNU|nr:TPA_asm: hypothetical protein HUJ06_003921 [Nelumbo nucifera]